MHELGIATEIVAAAVSEAEKHGAARITTVTVRVGVLRGIVPDSLRMYFDHAVKGTLAGGAALEIEEEPVLVACPACGETEASGLTLSCPACGRDGVAIRGGDYLQLVSNDVE
ncbi:MAG: hydrogenase maturation nickel metallochaperone HypA [Gemmatimonadota bacterium]